MMKTASTYLTASLGVLFCAMGADCVPDPPEIEFCTPADLPGCETGRVEGVPPLCTCVMGPEVVLPPSGAGSGVVKMTLSPGWSFNGMSGGIPAVALAGRDGLDGVPSTSQPLTVIDTERSGNTLNFAFESPGAAFHEIADFSQTAVLVDWGGPLTVSLTNPAGATVEATLPARALLPVAMEDDCELRAFSGEMTHGPVTVSFSAEMGSPGCE